LGSSMLVRVSLGESHGGKRQDSNKKQGAKRFHVNLLQAAQPPYSVIVNYNTNSQVKWLALLIPDSIENKGNIFSLRYGRRAREGCLLGRIAPSVLRKSLNPCSLLTRRIEQHFFC
jgi:hypothetical protein